MTWDKEKKKLEALRKEKNYDAMDEVAKKAFDDKESWS